MPPFPDEEAFAIMERELGQPIEAVFSSISERPVAGASLGQVRLGERNLTRWKQGISLVGRCMWVGVQG